MEAKSLPAPSGPVTQEAAAARVLITYVNRLHGLPVPGSDEDLPEFYRLGSGLCLVRDSKKRNVYNVTRARRCSCPAAKSRRALRALQDILSSEEVKAEKVVA
jgi:hypothetical protein